MLLALVTVSGCLGLLWLRQKIETTAQATRSLETAIVKEERRLRYLDTKIAEIHQPGFLNRQVDRLDLPLRPPKAEQVVYLEAIPERPAAEDLVAGTEKEAEDRAPYRRTFDLAVMESFVPRD
jgi:hypothetical protein